MATIRPTAVAGMFYPENPEYLKNMIKKFLDEAHIYANLPLPKGIIAPHAGYVYSGSVAASAYACLKNAQKLIKNVVLLAPAHHYPMHGIATTAANLHATPLGNILIDQIKIQQLTSGEKTLVTICEDAFTYEHAIEVHLPFLQMTLANDFSIIPLIVGSASIQAVEDVLEKLWNGPETLIIISSDLSHYCDYETALKLDKKTAELITSFDAKTISSENACGAYPMRGFLSFAHKKNLTAKIIDLRNSGDTAGDKNRVVGYGAFHFYEKK
jgi:hypothetical protein